MFALTSSSDEFGNIVVSEQSTRIGYRVKNNGCWDHKPSELILSLLKYFPPLTSSVISNVKLIIYIYILPKSTCLSILQIPRDAGYIYH